MKNKPGNSAGKKTLLRISGYLKIHRYSIIMLLIIILMVIAIYLNSDRISELKQLGYAGAFLIGLIANATVIFPMPGLLLLFTFSTIYNPVLIGLFGALGGSIGEISGYIIGRHGRRIAVSNKNFEKAENWIKKWGAGAIFIFSLAPFLPMDIAGIAAGALRYPVWKFLIACFLGKAILYILAGMASDWGWNIAIKYLG